jgi:hypothetical protein
MALGEADLLGTNQVLGVILETFFNTKQLVALLECHAHKTLLAEVFIAVLYLKVV